MVAAASMMMPDEYTPPNYMTYTVLPFLTAAAVHMSRPIAFLVLVHNPGSYYNNISVPYMW